MRARRVVLAHFALGFALATQARPARERRAIPLAREFDNAIGRSRHPDRPAAIVLVARDGRSILRWGKAAPQAERSISLSARPTSSLAGSGAFSACNPPSQAAVPRSSRGVRPAAFQPDTQESPALLLSLRPSASPISG